MKAMVLLYGKVVGTPTIKYEEGREVIRFIVSDGATNETQYVVFSEHKHLFSRITEGVYVNLCGTLELRQTLINNAIVNRFAINAITIAIINKAK